MYDVAVVGGGPAGGSAAIFLAKAGMKTLVLDNDRGQTRGAWLLNHYGFADGVSGPDLVEAGRQQSRNLGAEWVTCQVSDVQRSGGGFSITAENGDTYEAKQVVLATGAALALGETLNLAFAAGREARYPKVLQVDVDGRTSERGIWAAGIITGCSAHTIITCGHGAQVAIGLLSDALGKRVVQHDVLERAQRQVAERTPVDLQDHVDSENHTQPPAQSQLREHMQTQHEMQGQGQAHMNPQERIQLQSHMQSENPTESQTPQPTADMRQPGQMQPQSRMQPQIANAERQQTENEKAREIARQAEQRQEANDRRFQQAPQLRDHQGPQRQQPSDPQPSDPQQPPKQH